MIFSHFFISYLQISTQDFFPFMNFFQYFQKMIKPLFSSPFFLIFLLFLKKLINFKHF